MPPNRVRQRRRAVIGTALVVVLIVAVFGVYTSFRHVPPPPPAPGCQAGTGAQAIALDTDQAAIAATIAGIAARHKLPKYAVTIAYATALQESRLHDLDYGDRDSVGVFQQRPSQGWGTTAEIEDPVYATTRFFDALVQVPGYTKMPVAQAAQDVQHSADGSAYEQWAPVAAQLTAYFTGISPHDVSCWYTVAPVPVKADLTAAVRSLAQTVGPAGRNGVVVRITLPRSADKDGSSAVLHVRAGAAWTVAGWLVAHAQAYGLSDVRYAGYEWTAADGSMGWQPDSAATSTAAKNDPPGGSIVAG